MDYVISDEFLEKLKNPLSHIYVHGKMYYIVDDRNFIVGDVVLDRKDGCHGVIEVIIDDKAAVRDGCVIELAVPLVRLIKLRMFNDDFSN